MSADVCRIENEPMATSADDLIRQVSAEVLSKDSDQELLERFLEE